MEIIYKAFDGKEFEDEQECEEYEIDQHKKIWKNKIIAFDESKIEIDPFDFNNTFFIRIADEESYKDFVAASQNHYSEPPDGPGEWAFKDGPGWVPLFQIIKELEEQIAELEDMRDQMRGE